MLDVDWGEGTRGLVLRLPPIGKGLFPSYDLAMQVQVMNGLRMHSAVPVPVVFWHETDSAPLGREFVVMERVDGRIPTDNPGYHFSGWLKDLSGPDQQRVFDESISTLAAIHNVDIDSAGLRSSFRGVGLDSEFSYWSDYLDWSAEGQRFSAIDDAFEWCVANRPSTEPAAGLVWGDTRLGNIIYGDDLCVRAVLDWEMALLGPPEIDLGWYLFIERTALQFASQLEGFPDRGGTIKRYEHHLGREVRDIDFYEIWGGVRSAAIMTRVAADLCALGRVPQSFVYENPVTQLLTKLLTH